MKYAAYDGYIRVIRRSYMTGKRKTWLWRVCHPLAASERQLALIITSSSSRIAAAPSTHVCPKQARSQIAWAHTHSLVPILGSTERKVHDNDYTSVWFRTAGLHLGVYHAFKPTHVPDPEILSTIKLLNTSQTLSFQLAAKYVPCWRPTISLCAHPQAFFSSEFILHGDRMRCKRIDHLPRLNGI